MSLEVEKNAKPASKKRGYWGPFIENEPSFVQGTAWRLAIYCDPHRVLANYLAV